MHTHTKVVFLPLLMLLLGSIGLAQTSGNHSSSGGKIAEKHPSAHFEKSGSATGWISGPEYLPGNLQAFEENKGQYVNPLNNSKVLYACMTEGTRILFTESGVIYSIPEFENFEKKAGISEEEEEAQGLEIRYQQVFQQWKGANPHPVIVPEDVTPFSFGSCDAVNAALSLGPIKGFRKLLYKDVYPGVDVEYSFHPDRGIKYTVIAKAGADVRRFTMMYSGQKGLFVDDLGNLHIQTEAGDILDHAPSSVTSTGQAIGSSFLKNTSGEISFQIAAAQAMTGVVIDPWTVTPVTPTGTTKFVPSNVAIDGANNTYILGYDAGTKLMYEQKYGPGGGAPIWTYTFNEFPGKSWESDLAVDAAGNSYVGSPKGYSNSAGQNYGMVCIATGGTRTWFNNTYAGTDVYEVLNEAYNCSTNTLVEAGAGPTPGSAIGNVSQIAGVAPATGNLGTVFTQNITGEIYTGCVAPNGNYYCIASDSNTYASATPANTTGPYDNLICFTVAGTTVTKSWQTNIGYKFLDYHGKAGPNNIGTNGIAASCAFLYTSDGINLDKRSLTTGALITRVTIPGGSNCGTCGSTGGTWGNINSGVTVDLKCGYVYAGSVNNMYCFDANLNPVFTYSGLPGIVYDVYYNNGLVSCTGATAGNVGFVAQFVSQTCTTNIARVNPSCGASNGTATANPTFCAAPYTYLWTPSGQTTATATGLAAGTYTVQIGTNSSCVTVSDTVILKSASGGTETIAGTNVKCAGGTNGTATTTMAGGTTPFTYTWAPAPGGGQGTATATGLGAGTYTCTVADAGGCTTTQTVTITAPTPFTSTLAQTNVTCNGGSDGTATVTAAGGTTTYTYSWSPAPASGTTAAATGLTAGTYTCALTDANGCTTSSTVTITQPAPVTATASSVPALCGSANGSATATPAAGVGTYTYSWNPGGQTGQTATALASGTYTCTIKDANGCSTTATTTVGSTGGPTVTLGAVTNVTCFGLCNGAIPVTSTGGIAPYTYSWTPAPGAGQGTATATSLCAGAYTCNVTDSQGCLTSTTATVTQPTALAATTTGTNVTCFGLSNGSVTGSASGGTTPYTYTWNPAPGGGQGTTTATGLPAGTYTMTVTDGNGCTITPSSIITQPTLLTINAAGVNATCNAKCDGQLICIPAGGTASYTYSWNTGCTGASCNAICAGTYTATVTDSHGCTANDTALVNQPTALTMSVFPKPSHCNKPDGKDSVSVNGGTPGYTYTWTPAGGTGATTSSYTGLVTATYTVVVKDNHGCPDSLKNTVPNLPGVFLAPVSTTKDTCFGSSDGTATVNATGGFTPYTYSWSPAPGGGQGSVTATGLAAGSYTCTVTDSANCINNVVMAIGQPTPVTLAPGPPATICIGACTTLSSTGAGGTPTYVYTWSLNGVPLASNTVCPLVSTTYTAVCSDSHGCVSPPVVVRVTVNPPLEVVASGAKKICPGASTPLGGLGSGGNGIYSYSWMPTTGLSNPNIANPVANPTVTTTYTVIVSDNCGTPVDSDMVTVTLFPAPVVNFTSTDTVKCAPVCVTFTGTSAPACATGSWTFGDGGVASTCNTAQHCYNVAGNYSVTYNVIDIDGCPGSKTITNFINALPVPEAAFSASPQPTTIINPEIFFTDHSSSDAISWNWTLADLPGATSILQNPKYTYPDTGCYMVTLIVTAANTCTDTAKQPVCIQPEFTFYAPNTFTPNGDGKNDVWMPFGIGIDPQNYHLMMFDRWGNLMFETHTWGEGWDGRANHGANIAQIDTYVWKVDLKDVFHNKHNYVGHCNIIK